MHGKIKEGLHIQIENGECKCGIGAVCSFSLFCDIPLEFTKIVMTGGEQDHISFRLLMDQTTKDIMIRIFFQMPGITEVQMFSGGERQTLQNPFSLNVDEKINVEKRKYKPGLN